MHKLKSSQKSMVKQFTQLTATGEKTAISCLQQNEWMLDRACDEYFTNPDLYNREPRAASIDRRKLENWFNRYTRCVQDNNKLGVDGVAQMIDELRISPEDRKVLILAWKLQAKTQCEFTKEEFMNGMSEMAVDNLDSLRNRLCQYESELISNGHTARLRELYSFTWDYAKGNPSAKTLDSDVAVAYWRILMSGMFPHLELWINFVEGQNRQRAISRDTWNLVLEFALTIDQNMSNYDFDGAWPTLLDEFVEWARERMKG